MSNSVPTPSETDDLLNSPAQTAGILAEIQSLVACLMILASVVAVLHVVHTMHWPSQLNLYVRLTLFEKPSRHSGHPSRHSSRGRLQASPRESDEASRPAPILALSLARLPGSGQCRPARC